MPRYKITVEYDGTDTVGWQKQPGKTSIQSTIEKAIFNLSQERVETFASGRTDAGVHALGQVVHFDLDKNFPERKIMQGLNFHMIGRNVVVVKAEKVDEEFHARFSSKKRYYKYIILNRSPIPVLDRNRVWHVPYDLDIKKMERAAKHLQGKHDFTSFRSTECQAKSPVKTLGKIKIEREGDYVILYFSAQSFLHHMVRNLTGTLMEVGRGKIKPDKIPSILEARDRRKAGMQAPAYGLYFTKVDY